MFKKLSLGLTTLATVSGAYLLFIRPWMQDWGTTEQEVQQPLPGDELVAQPTAATTLAVTVKARARDIWPWLVQMGQGRGGWYTYDWLENLIGLDIHNADRIVPAWQQLQVGDSLRLTPDPYLGRLPAQRWTVVEIQPERALVLRQAPPENPSLGTWVFVLSPIDAQTTRLLLRARGGDPAGVPKLVACLLTLLLLEPMYFVMNRKMLLGIKKRAERSRRQTSEPARAATPAR
jgi:hypothetical protein